MARPSLRTYQKEDAHWLASRDRALHIGEPGTGKTPIAIHAAETAKARSVLVICPVPALPIWKREWSRWAAEPAMVFTVSSTDQIPTLPVQTHGDTFVLIVSEVLFRTRASKLDEPYISVAREALSGHWWDVTILDEAHYFRSHTSIRTREALSMIACSRKMWALTGTPIVANHMDVYPLATVMLPKETMALVGDRSPEAWERHFVEIRTYKHGGREIRKVVGNKNTTDLQGFLDIVSRRRTKAFDLAGAVPSISHYKLPLSEDHIKSGTNLFLQSGAALSPNIQLLNDEGLMETLQRHQDNPSLAIPTARRELGMLKMVPCFNWVVDRLDADPFSKIIIFGWHVEIVEEMARLLQGYGVVTITGATSLAERERAERHFQCPAPQGGARVFCGQIAACGVAITLTAADTVLMLEEDWLPGNNQQAIDRAHRITQRKPVSVFHAYFPNSLDERVTTVQVRRLRDIHAALPKTA